MSKIVIFLSLIFMSAVATAYTEIDKFECSNGEMIELKSSLLPNGQRLEEGNTKTFAQMEKVNCQNEEILKKWNTYGLENCYANDKVLFSFFGFAGLLKIKKRDFFAITLCSKVDTIQ